MSDHWAKSLCLSRLRNRKKFWLFAFTIYLLASLATQAQSLSNSVFQKHQTEVETAVEKALQFLADQQKFDGTYDDSHGRSVGIVALAGMAFLSAGHSPGYGEYEKEINRCIDYILESQKPNGLLDHG
ncbi:MAG: hypothetical protein AAF226_17110, partial [Verrucomicrobiota bacterium]